MIQLVQVGNASNTPRKEYICDTTTEMNTIPKDFGTMVLNLEDTSVYVCNGSGEFVKVSK